MDEFKLGHMLGMLEARLKTLEEAVAKKHACRCGGTEHDPSGKTMGEAKVVLSLVRTVDAEESGIVGSSFVPYKEFRWKDWMHSGDCVMKDMTARYFSDGRIEFSSDARSEDDNDCWNPFTLSAYNASNAHLHTTGNHVYCMQERSKDYPVRWSDAYPQAFFNELHHVIARGRC